MMISTMNTLPENYCRCCPKCGSPQESPKLDGTTARIWFTCGSYGYADKPDQVFRSSDKCLDREEINAGDYWHSKWKEACENARIKHKQVCELKRERNRLIDDFQASTIHSCGDSCNRPMCVLRRERDKLREELERFKIT